MEGCLGVKVRRFSLLSQGLRHHKVLALDHVPSSTTIPSSVLGELMPARPVTPSPWASRSGNSTAQRRGSTPSSPKAFAKLGQLSPTTILDFGRLAVRICAEPSTASCSCGCCKISTRRSVGYETMRSQTHATLGRLQVAQVESDTIGSDYTLPEAAVHTLTGGTKTLLTSPHSQGRYTLPANARRFLDVWSSSPLGNVTTRLRLLNVSDSPSPLCLPLNDL